MKRVIAAIFAHPDDEAFGPSGTIAKWTKEGVDVYLLCATKGESGEKQNPKTKGKLYDVRQQELLKSAKILGIKKVYFLGFTDGTLNNNRYHEVAKKIMDIFEEIKPDTILTVEHLGVSGHLDHIAISMISTYVFFHCRFCREIYYHYVLKDWIKKRVELYGEYFIHQPPGYDDNEADKVIDVGRVWDIKLAAMRCHQSQLKDVKRVSHMSKLFSKKEYFFVKTK